MTHADIEVTVLAPLIAVGVSSNPHWDLCLFVNLPSNNIDGVVKLLVSHV